MRIKVLITLVITGVLIFLVSAVPQIIVSSTSPPLFYTSNTPIKLNFSLTGSNLYVNQSGTEQKIIKAQSDTVWPQIDFISPTPVNGTITTNTSFQINVSISESNLSELTYNWNGTNYTFYNNSLVFLMNFDNRTTLNENESYFADASGNNNHANCTNCPTLVGGKYNGAYDFSSGDTDCVYVADSPSLRVSEELTMSVWVYMQGVTGQTQRVIAKGSGGTSPYYGYQLNILNSLIPEFGLTIDDSTSFNSAEHAIALNNWYMVTMTYNSSNWSIYINGSVDASGSLSGNIDSGAYMMGIGCRADNLRWTSGLIDEVMIWNRTLSPYEVSQLYMTNLYKFNQTQWYLSINQTNNPTTVLDYGMYNYQVFAKDGDDNFNETDLRFLNISADSVYPIFSDYWDNNGSLEGSGTAFFNVTISNTNGTVLLEVDGNNVSAQNLTANVYNASYSFIGAGDYGYKWHSWGSGADHLYNVSESRVYTVNSSSDSVFPNVSLNYPEDQSTMTTININFNCTSYDNEDLKNVSLYFNSSTDGDDIALVQHKNYSQVGAQTTAPLTISCNLTSPATVGNLIVTAVGTDKFAGTYAVPAGFTLIDSYNGTSVSGAMAYKVATGGEQDINWSYTTRQESSCWVGEFSGVDTTSPLDVNASNTTFVAANSNTGKISTGKTSETSQAGELAVAMYTIDTISNTDNGYDWTEEFIDLGLPVPSGDLGAGSIGTAYKILSSTGTVETIANWSVYSGNAVDQAYAIVATFKKGEASYWERNETKNIRGVVNESIFSKVLTTNRDYTWGCYVCDLNNNCNWSVSNYSFSIDFDYYPNVTLDSPAKGINRTSLFTDFNFTARDDSALTNATLYLCNTTQSPTEQSVFKEWIANRSSWSYNDSDAYPGENWFNTSFDFSTWATGSSYFCVGETDCNTYLENVTQYSYISYYFKKSFTLTNASEVVNMSYAIDFDDNYVVYINGHMINSSNLATDWTNHSEISTIPGGTNHDSTKDASPTAPVYPTIWLNSTQLDYLVTGTNYIAVAIKQFSASSSDAVLELSLQGYENQTVNTTICDSSFSANRTITLSGTENITNISLTLNDNNSYFWNVWVCDNANQCNFSGSNYTLKVNSSYVEPPVYPIWCGFHAIHTTYSDGTMSQDQAVTNMDTYFDCAGALDHDTSLSEAEWDDWNARADANNVDNNFTFFQGTEWSGSQHVYYITMNPSDTLKKANDADFDTIAELATWMQQNSSVGQYNHPARTSGGTDFTNSANLNESWIPLAEMVNQNGGNVHWHWSYVWNCSDDSGCNSYNNPHSPGQTADGTGWIRKALDLGYHIGFSCGNDYHGAYPLTPYCYTGLTGADNWTRGGIYETLKKRHTWTAESKTWMSVTANNGSGNYTMGDIFSYSSNTPNLTINYSINATGGDTIVNVSLFYKGIIVNLTTFSGQQNVSGQFIQNLTPGVEEYLFIETTQNDGERAWSSPMWVNYSLDDTTYPVFSNYWDDNGTLNNSGLGLFNVTLTNTNGTVLLEINNTNITASNITANVYNVSVNLTAAGTYSYSWNAYGNGSSTLFNNSQTRYYTVNATPSSEAETSTTDSQTSSGGGGGSYMSEQNTKAGELRIKTVISPNKTLITKIKDDRGTGVKEIELTAKNWISGEIYIIAYNETPNFCSIKYQDEHKVYRVIDFNNTFKEGSVGSGRLKIGVSKDWIYSNNISEIKFVRCYPSYEEVKASYESETDSEGIYNVYINKFSTYAILGTLGLENPLKNEEKIWTSEAKPSIGKMIIWLVIILILAGLVILLIKHRIYIKERIHSKFLDFDFRFRIGKKIKITFTASKERKRSS